MAGESGSEPAPRPAAQRIGGNLRRLRQGRGLSQSALAAALGRARTTVCRWETGERMPTVPALLALAAALGCDPAELLTGASVGDGHGAAGEGG